MKIESLPDAEAVARRAAALVAADARGAVASRGSFGFAVSGGSTPWVMLRALADEDLPWQAVHVEQADVALTTGVYQGRRRMTVTYPLLARARRILWLVTGSGKSGMLARLRDGDRSSRPSWARMCRRARRGGIAARQTRNRRSKLATEGRWTTATWPRC